MTACSASAISCGLNVTSGGDFVAGFDGLPPQPQSPTAIRMLKVAVVAKTSVPTNPCLFSAFSRSILRFRPIVLSVSFKAAEKYHNFGLAVQSPLGVHPVKLLESSAMTSSQLQLWGSVAFLVEAQITGHARPAELRRDSVRWQLKVWLTQEID